MKEVIATLNLRALGFVPRFKPKNRIRRRKILATHQFAVRTNGPTPLDVRTDCRSLLCELWWIQ